jgi:hypothetical protein
MDRRVSRLAALLLSGTIAAQGGVFGTGCDTQNPAAGSEVSCVCPPSVGGVFHLRASGLAPGLASTVVVGFAPLATPFDLGRLLGRPGCLVYVDPALTLPGGIADADGLLTTTFGVPNDPALVNGRLLFQELQLGPPARLVLTNALDAVIRPAIGFTSATFVGRLENVALGPPQQIVPARVDGSLVLTSSGDATGVITVSAPSSPSVIVTFGPGSLVASTTGATIDLCVGRCDDLTVLVDGVPTKVDSLIAQYGADVQGFGANVGSWSAPSRCMLALIAVMQTVEMAHNICAAQAAGQEAGFWCKVACVAMAGAACPMLPVFCVAGCLGTPILRLAGYDITCAKWLNMCTLAGNLCSKVYGLVLKLVWK